MKRCSWVKEDHPLYVAYHDTEWGNPLYDDQKLFELLCLETYQSGLSWETILNKREAFREAFYHYDIDQVAMMDDEMIEQLLLNPNIIRHRGKLSATLQNARAVKRVQAEFGSFSNYLWGFVNNQTIVNDVEDYQSVPSQTSLSQSISKELKKRGFMYVGPTCIYSFLQASGMINDHENDCYKKSVIS